MKNRKKPLLILIFIIMILLVANPKTISYLKAKTNSEEDIFAIKEIAIPHSNLISYGKLDGGLIKYREGILIYYNSAGEQVWSVNLAINRPIIKTNSNSVFIIDENKNQILRINKKGEQVYKITLDKQYENFNICDDNYVALHHNSEDVVEYVTIIDDKGKKVSQITLGEGHITNISISKADDRVAVSTIIVNGDNLENKVLIYDLNANLISAENFENNIILNLFFDEKGNLIVTEETNIISINKNNKISWEKAFNGPISIVNTKNKNFITTYIGGNNKKSIIYARTENIIKTLSYSGKQIGEAKPTEKIIGIDSYKNSVIAYSPRTIFKYDKSGNLKIEYPYSSDILKCFMLSDNNIVVTTKEKVSFLSFKAK